MNAKYIDDPTKEEFKRLVNSRVIDKVLDVHAYKEATLCPLFVEPEEESIEILQPDGSIVLEVNSNIYYEPPFGSICIDVKYEIDETYIYLGCIYKCWGHYITDGLSKAWYLLTDEYKNKYSGRVKIAVSFIGNNVVSIPSQLLELYELLGVNTQDIIVVSEPTKIRELIVPDNSLFFHNGSRHFTKEYRNVINAITNSVEPIKSRKYEKVYLSRTRFTKGNADFGEKSLENVFRLLGYKVMHPQEHSVREQIAMFKTAKSFVSTTGSLGHNSVFCNPGTEIILLRKCFAIFDYQLVINEAKDLKVTYVDTHLSCFVNNQANNGPFFLYRNANFCSFVKDRYNLKVSKNFSTKRYMRYMRICMMRGDMKYRNQAPDFYFEKLKYELQNDSWKRDIIKKLGPIVSTKILNKFTGTYFKNYR